MTFKELQSLDVENAYWNWKSVKHAKYVLDIPERFHEYFDDYCECGSENIVKAGLRMMTCCDPKCPIKQGFAIAEMLTRLGAKGLQEATCGKIYRAMKAENDRRLADGREPILCSGSYVAVLAVPWSKYPISVAETAKGLEFYQACMQALQKRMTFPQLVSMLAIPGLGADAETLFAGLNSVREFALSVQKCGSVKKFCDSRGFHSEMIAFNVHNAAEDIYTANRLFMNSMRMQGSFTISVCMTGAITFRGTKITKEKYLAACNQLCANGAAALFEVKMNAAIESNSFILYSSPSTDRKFLAGKSRGVITDQFGTHPVLMHVDDFYSYLERVMEKWNQRDQNLTLEETSKNLKLWLVEEMGKVLT